MTEKKRTTWRPGQSGNPKGRAPGTGEVGKLRAAIADRLPDILKALVDRAVGGDVGAARLLLERVIAPLKAVEMAAPMNLGTGTLPEQGRAVLGEVGQGNISPAQGAQLLAAIGQLARVVEIDELEKRIAILEGLSNGKHS